MRKKMDSNEKRSKIIGIKVQQEMWLKLQYIAKREGKTLSTHIYDVLTNYIEEYFQISKTEWNNMTPEEKRGIS